MSEVEVTGGVSSFGYAGTIAHLEATCTSRTEATRVPFPSLQLKYGRRHFPWTSPTTLAASAATSSFDAIGREMYALSWAAAPHSVVSLHTSSWLLLRAVSTRTSVMPDNMHFSSCQVYREQTPKVVVLLLTASVAVVSTFSSQQLTVAAMHVLAAHEELPPLVVLSCGAYAATSLQISLNAASHTGHSTSWGLARVHRLEQPALTSAILSVDVTLSAHCVAEANASFALVSGAVTTEAEIVQEGTSPLFARLRRCGCDVMTSGEPPLPGRYAITGGAQPPLMQPPLMYARSFLRCMQSMNRPCMRYP